MDINLFSVKIFKNFIKKKEDTNDFENTCHCCMCDRKLFIKLVIRFYGIFCEMITIFTTNLIKKFVITLKIEVFFLELKASLYNYKN